MRSVLAGLLALSAALASASPVATEFAPEFRYAAARQFDFWIGAWRVNLRMRQEDGSWQDTFIADARIWPLLDGKAILELWDSEAFKGFSLRWHDPESDQWQLWLNWPSPTRSAGSGLSGGFRHGRGEFFSTRELDDGGTLTTRYTFSDIASDRLRWDDAYSYDGGLTWQNNWIMEFTRTAEAALPPDRAVDAHTWDSGARCQQPEFDRINRLAGRWQGEVADTNHFGTRHESAATASFHRILDGCAVMVFLEAPDALAAQREFRLLTWNTIRSAYEENQLDNQPGTPLRVRYGPHGSNGMALENSEAGHRAAWSVDAAGVLRIREFRVPAAGGSLAQRVYTFRRLPAD